MTPSTATAVLETLTSSKVRAALLIYMMARGAEPASMSELARRLGFTPAAIRREVLRLSELGLVLVEAVGTADLVRVRKDSPLHAPIVALVKAAHRPEPEGRRQAERLRQELACYGAPFARACEPDTEPPRPVETVLLDALEAAHQDATVLRVLPLVLAGHASTLDWRRLKEDARRRKLKSELGMLVDLTGDLTGQPHLVERVADLRDERHRLPRHFLPLRSRYERAAAEERTPAAARRWGFLMNMGEDIFRETLRKHAPSRV